LRHSSRGRVHTVSIETIIHFSCAFVVVECPNMTLEALDAYTCPKNGEILLKNPSSLVSFDCTYANSAPSKTTYRWKMDGKLQQGLTSKTAKISIPSGSHTVTCEAVIDVRNLSEAKNCSCVDSKSVKVTVVGTYDGVHDRS